MGAQVQRLFYNILAENVAQTAKFYTELLGLKRHFDSDWFVILTPEQGPLIELGIFDRSHEVVPDHDFTHAAGLLTFVVDDVMSVFQHAKLLGIDIVEPPRAMFYGQTRMVLRDPNGLLVDISSLTPSTT